MQIHNGLETNHVLKDSRLEHSWLLWYSSLLVVYELSAMVCYDFRSREVTQLRGRKKILMIQGDLYIRLHMEVKDSGSM